MLIKLIIIISAVLSLHFVNTSYANHAPNDVEMANMFVHNNGSTNWQVAFRNSAQRIGDTRYESPVLFVWTNNNRNISVPAYSNSTFDWHSGLVWGPRWSKSANRHPPYRMQWGTTCIDPEEKPIFQSDDYDGYKTFLFGGSVTYPYGGGAVNRSGGGGANNSGADISYAYGNSISGRTDACPFPCPPPSCSGRCGTLRNNCGYGVRSAEVSCGGCGANYCGSGGTRCDLINPTCNSNNYCVNVVESNNTRACRGQNNCCFNDSDCGGGQYCHSLDGPNQCRAYARIGGLVSLNGNPFPGVNVQMRNASATNWNNIRNDTSGSNGRYNFDQLRNPSDHDVRITNPDSCAYNISSTNPIQNITATPSTDNVNFQLVSERYNITGRAYWDPEADGTRNGNYIRDNIRFTAAPGGRDCTTTDGSCAITGNPTIPGGRNYDVTLSGLQAGDIMFGVNPQTGNITCSGFTANFDVTKGYRISGNIFQDVNFNGRYNPGAGETLYTRGTEIRIEELGVVPANRAEPKIDIRQTVRDGTYLFNNLFRGEYRVTINPAPYPANGYRFSQPASGYSFTVFVGPTCRVGGSLNASCVAANPWVGSIQDLNFGITPVYSVSGGVFIDTNGNDIKDGDAEPYWNTTPQEFTIVEYPSGDAPNITLLNPNTVRNNPGTFNFSYMLERTFRLYFNWQAEIFQFYDISPAVTAPLSVSNRPYFSLDFSQLPGNGAVSPRFNANNPNRQQSSITNLNFALREITQDPWMHTFGGDIRIDDGFTNEMPSGRNFSGNIGTQVKHGIVFNRVGSTGINVSPGAFSNPENWYVRDSGLENATIKTSYLNLRKSIIDSGNGNKIIRNDCASCNIDRFDHSKETIINDFNGDVVLTSDSGTYTVTTADKNYIFLVPGNLTINTNIDVPEGSTIIFAAGGDITINGRVTNLQGIYVATNNFTFASQVTNPVTGEPRDVPITIEGSIIFNGSLNRRRRLTPRESREPQPGGTSTINIRYRPDFVLNLPSVIRTAVSKRIEVAPGD